MDENMEREIPETEEKTGLPEGEAFDALRGPKPDEAFEEGEFLTFAALPKEKKQAEAKKAKAAPGRRAPRRGPSVADLPFEDYRPEREEAAVPSPEQLKNDRLVRLAQVRRRRAARRARALVVLTLLLAFAMAWALGAFGSSIAALSDVADSIRIGLTPSEGFPVKTNIPEIYQVEELSGGFVELGSQDLVAYSASGVRLRSIQHNYSRPALTVGDTRFCVYARAGNELRVESRTQTLYTKTTEQPLLLCAMGADGSLAVATRSTRYAAEVSVYNPNMEYVYGWNPTEKQGTPCRMAFAEGGTRLAAACLKAQDGVLTTGLYFLDTGRDELLSVSEEVDATPLQLTWLDDSLLLAVFEDHASTYNALTGAEKHRYDFEGETLLSSSVSGRRIALLFSGGSGTSQEHLVVLNDSLETTADVATQGEGSQVVFSRANIYILEETGVSAYETDGTYQWTAPLSETPLALVDGKKLLVFTGVEADAVSAPAQKGE